MPRTCPIRATPAADPIKSRPGAAQLLGNDPHRGTLSFGVGALVGILVNLNPSRVTTTHGDCHRPLRLWLGDL